jgi:hypothetical protein
MRWSLKRLVRAPERPILMVKRWVPSPRGESAKKEIDSVGRTSRRQLFDPVMDRNESELPQTWTIGHSH